MAVSNGTELDAGVVELRRAEGLVLILDTPKGNLAHVCFILLLLINSFSGRGVFASRDISAGTQLDVCPVLVLDPNENEEHIRKTDLYNYT